MDDYNENGGFDPNDSKTDNFRVIAEDEPYCGDGEVNEENEECDDGNNDDGDGCSADCLDEPAPPDCGDGDLDGDEECDDGNNTNGDGCSAICTEEPPPPVPCCGDGDKEGDEECDDGNNDDGDGCSSDCELECPPDPPVCGNGIIEIGEECDGNVTLLHICIDCLLISVSI
ncbi:MAG: DUF4215 domain-containing protein [Polyangiaceae bacterium]|nr:DUF4215 domain-containing protein [Polyangiaceae bacterium]